MPSAYTREFQNQYMCINIYVVKDKYEHKTLRTTYMLKVIC